MDAPTPRRSRSGPNIPDSQRHTALFRARVDPPIDAAIRALAARWRLSLGETLAELLRRCGDATEQRLRGQRVDRAYPL